MSDSQYTNDANKEEEILSMIKQYSELEKEFQRRHKGDLQIILLVGETGAGKSTLFNYLTGTQLSFINVTKMGNELAASDGSPIGSGATSITTKPYYHFFEQNKHLLVDFPGFSDTRGETEKLLVQLFFHKLVKMVPVKIVYVLRHPDDDLPGRGQQFQEFIKTSFGEQNLDISKFSILLNCYNEDLEDRNLIERFKYQFKQKYQTFDPKNVFVVRKVKNNEDLQKKFSEENRQKLLTNLIKTNRLTFNPKGVPHSEIISEYIRNVGGKIISNYCSLLQYVNALQIKEKSILNQLLRLLQNFVAKLKDESISSKLSWSQIECKDRIALTELLQIKWQIIETKNFQLVYEFFKGLSDYISGYKNFSKSCKNAADQIIMTIETINKKIEVLEKLEQNSLLQEQFKQQEILMEKERKEFKEERTEWQEERTQWKEEKMQWQDEKAKWEGERVKWEEERVKIQEERVQLQRELERLIQQERDDQRHDVRNGRLEDFILNMGGLIVGLSNLV